MISVKALLSSFKWIYDKKLSPQAPPPLHLPSTGESLVGKTPHGRDLLIMRVNCSLPFHVSCPLETEMAVAHLLLYLFIRPLKGDINKHHYCRFPPLAQLTEPCKGQDAGMKGRRLSRQKLGSKMFKSAFY